MAYPTCPSCRVPQNVADEAQSYQCFSCFMMVSFRECPMCEAKQTVNPGWREFTCCGCGRRIEIPEPKYGEKHPHAAGVEGVGIGPFQI